MRNVIYATFLLACASTAAFAQMSPERPREPAPAANAPFEQREAWCQDYAAWFVGATPAVQPPPADQRPTQRLENELTYCKADPQQYERETRAEINRPDAVEPG